jgi:DNA-binding transcriptional regulator YdaS (Cro superfamily)
MKLAEYLDQHSESQTNFAKRLGVSQGLVHQWLASKTRVTAEQAIRIEQATDGQVTRAALRPDLFDVAI